MNERSWVRTPTMETIFQAPFIWIKVWNRNRGKTLTWHCCICCNPANWRVDFEEWSAYKIQLHGIEWIVSLSADWDQSPTKKKSNLKKMHYHAKLPAQLTSKRQLTGMKKCNQDGCPTCPYILYSKEVKSSLTKQAFLIKGQFSCLTKGVIYKHLPKTTYGCIQTTIKSKGNALSC